MKYMGSKARIARFIIPIMTKERSGRPWVEPFVGGGNIIDKVDGYRFAMIVIPMSFRRWKLLGIALRTFQNHSKSLTKTIIAHCVRMILIG